MLVSVIPKPALLVNPPGFGAIVPNQASTPAFLPSDDSFQQVNHGLGLEKPGAGARLLMAKSLQQAVCRESGQVSYLSAYTSEPIPALFVGKAERQLLIHRCAQFIQHYKHSPLKKGQDISRSFVVNGQNIKVSPVNFSSDGALLKLDIAGKSFGLKLYDYALEPSMSPEMERQGVAAAYQDASVGFYMNAKAVPNVVRLEAINPDEGWLLQQYVPRNGMLPARKGPSLASLIGSNVIEMPEIHDKNCYRVADPDGNPYDVVVELSALRFQPEPISWEAFVEKLAQVNVRGNREYMGELTSLVFALPPNKRLAAFETLLASSEPKVRHAGISALSALPAKDIETAIDTSMAMALSTPLYQRQDQRFNTQLMRTAVRIFLLPSPEAQWRKFQELLAVQEPYTALGLGAVIPCLPHEYQLEAIQKLLCEFPKPVTLSMPDQPFLKQSFDPREYLFEELQNLPPETLIKAVWWMVSVDPSLCVPAQKALWYFDETVRQQVLSMLQNK